MGPVYLCQKSNHRVEKPWAGVEGSKEGNIIHYFNLIEGRYFLDSKG